MVIVFCNVWSSIETTSLILPIPCKQRFQMYFLEIHVLYLNSNFTVCHWGPIYNESILVRVMAWRRTADRLYMNQGWSIWATYDKAWWFKWKILHNQLKHERTDNIIVTSKRKHQNQGGNDVIMMFLLALLHHPQSTFHYISPRHEISLLLCSKI